jgi:hypothetical protein
MMSFCRQKGRRRVGGLAGRRVGGRMRGPTGVGFAGGPLVGWPHNLDDAAVGVIDRGTGTALVISQEA